MRGLWQSNLLFRAKFKCKTFRTIWNLIHSSTFSKMSRLEPLKMNTNPLRILGATTINFKTQLSKMIILTIIPRSRRKKILSQINRSGQRTSLKLKSCKLRTFKISYRGTGSKRNRKKLLSQSLNNANSEPLPGLRIRLSHLLSMVSSSQNG